MDYNRIYAYTTKEVEDKEWVGKRKGKGLIKVGQTRNEVEARVKAQLQGSPEILKGGYTILLDEEALDINGIYFKDVQVFKWLKAMGVHRIPKTEWFEVTIEEVKEALNYAISGVSLRSFSHRKQDNVENRGSIYNKDEARKEKNFIKDEDRVIRIMELYPEADTLVKLGKRFVEHYNIKQYSASTTSNFIGEIMKALIEDGVVKNLGSFSKPKLKLTGKKFSSVKIVEPQKPKATLAALKELIKNAPDGVTVKDIKDKYEIPNKSYLYELLNQNFIKIKSFFHFPSIFAKKL